MIFEFSFWFGIVIGGMFGSGTGFLIAALMSAASQADDDIEEALKRTDLP